MDSKLKISAYITIGLIAACLLFWIYGNLFPVWHFEAVQNFVFIIAASAAAIAAFFAYKKFGWDSKEGKVWILLSAGMLIFAFAEFLWFYLDTFIGIYPYPSIADVFYLLGYFAMIPGILIELSILKKVIHENDVLKSVIISVIFLVFSAIFVLVPVATSADYGFMAKALSIVYPLLDIFLMFSALLFLFSFKNSKMSKTWAIIAVALALFAFADTSFSYLDLNSMYAGMLAIISDIPWMASYLLFAFGAYYHQKIMQGDV